MLGFDAARPAARPSGRPFFLKAVENFMHVASLSIMREIASPIRRRQIRDPATWSLPALRGTIAGINNPWSEDELMAESELHRKGAAMRRQLMGDAAVERSAREIYSDPVMKKFIDVATETVFGALWTRPGLDLKTRALICVVSDAATGREPELGLHLRMALRQGWTEEELTEALLHLSGYVGVPVIRESMMVASKAFADFRAEKAAQNLRTS
jgi:4-carboxymuconolactone decarboxylase